MRVGLYLPCISNGLLTTGARPQQQQQAIEERGGRGNGAGAGCCGKLEDTLWHFFCNILIMTSDLNTSRTCNTCASSNTLSLPARLPACLARLVPLHSLTCAPYENVVKHSLANTFAALSLSPFSLFLSASLSLCLWGVLLLMCIFHTKHVHKS